MNKYLASVRVKGQTVKTIVFAESSLHALLILEFQFGIGRVVSAPSLKTRATEGYKTLDEVIEAIKPVTPQQAKLNSLKKQKELASKNLKAERDRQKLAKAQKTIASVTTSLP